MTYILTLWLIWTAPFDATLVQYEAPSCVVAVIEVFNAVVGDGVTDFHVVSCELVQEV